MIPPNIYFRLTFFRYAPKYRFTQALGSKHGVRSFKLTKLMKCVNNGLWHDL
jgi:hypothetical protein